MREFCHRKKVYLFFQMFIAKDMKVDFKLLIYPLYFSIGLWVVGEGELEVIH